MGNELSEVFGTEADQTIIGAVEENTEQVAEGSEEVTGEKVAAPPADEAQKVVIDQLKTDLEQANRRANAFQTKALDEVNKRQAMQQPVERPDAYVEPDKAIEFEINEMRKESDTRFLGLSESNARLRHTDFEDMQTLFGQMAENNPVLAQQAIAQADPHEWLYQQAKHHNEFKDVSSIDDLKVKMKAEAKAEFEAEHAKQQNAATEQAITDAIPNSLATATAAGGVTTPMVGQVPLEKLFD